MPWFRSMFALGLCAALGHAQAASDDATFLRQARAKYDAPFGRNLQSFTCAVAFSWKQHFNEVVRLGDEGTDDEIERLIQPIHTRVTVTSREAAVSAGMTEAEVAKLPHGGMAEDLLEHAVRFSLNTWLVASNNVILPPEGTPVHVVPSGTGYELDYKVQTFDVELLLTHTMSLQSEGVKGSSADRQETEFRPGPQGLLLSSITLGEDGNFRPGNLIHLTYTYQDVGGFQVPESVSVLRESHHEGWHYKLTDCTTQVAR